MIRIIASLLEANNEQLLQRVFDFIEEAASTQDEKIIEVLRD